MDLPGSGAPGRGHQPQSCGFDRMPRVYTERKVRADPPFLFLFLLFVCSLAVSWSLGAFTLVCCREIVLSETEDAFFASHMYANWGDLCTAVKTLMDNFQNIHKTTSNISSIGSLELGCARAGKELSSR